MKPYRFEIRWYHSADPSREKAMWSKVKEMEPYGRVAGVFNTHIVLRIKTDSYGNRI